MLDLAQHSGTWDLHDVDVCGEVSVVVYTSCAQQFEWEGYGLKFRIREGSLPASVEQCTINIKASLTGKYEFPENCYLVSAIFWFRCETVRKFVKPIIVELQHCAKVENTSNHNLSFVRAFCSQKQLPYTFAQLLGGNFTSHSSYGIIDLNSFSGVGITQEGTEEREYYSRLVYLIQRSEIHFIVTWNVDTHLTVIKNEYEKEGGAVFGPDQPIEFESNSNMITLDIPVEGITVEGWNITPLIRPVVTKKQVDNFKPGKGTPRCQLKVEFKGIGMKTRIMRRTALQGAKHPHNIYMIDLSNFCSDATTPPGLPLRPTNDTPKPDIKDLIKELYTTASDKWEAIGLLLGIEPSRLDIIKEAQSQVPENCLREMLKVWLKTVSPPPSWAAIADAIEWLGDQQLATHLRRTYIV